ncbi:hypothetical protein ROJ8625_01569 [Roseivivax jejudonensis]|uniref:Sulfotransferase domain protein n=1 Tax=Roseivivax jejudonensis TaxID=1529041 RepID=A0A1X6YW60_9RHOB|nr:hypothetical protein [Roseivivax jejudonensis]SLN33371.1 hypothetical protein ROJ8625_01569 [Roseivivax jejudonensis]
MTRPVFVLGLGAQKAGTSWLYHYLVEAGAAFDGIKERHVWDVIEDPEMFSRFRVTEATFRRKPDSPRLPMLRLRHEMQNVEGAYARHFRALVTRTGAALTGDLTPSYGALSAATLARIRDTLEAAGFEIRVVFLMRDPVERIWSAVRMERRFVANQGGDLSALPPEPDQVAAAYRAPDVALRTRYDRTIEAIETVFAPGAVFYGLYETLFTEAELARLSRFLGVSCRPDALGRRANATRTDAVLPPALRAEIRRHYASVYAVCAERFPDTVRLWSAPG